MARDILSEYGNDSHQPQAPRARSGGITSAKPTSYSPPCGPTSINDPQTPKRPNYEHVGHSGTQGMHGGGSQTSGSPGIGGTNRGMGTNRRG